MDVETHYIANESMMEDLWGSLSRCLWREDFWLPEGLSWEDLRSRENLTYPDPIDIWVYPILLGGLYLILSTWVLEPLILVPLAKSLGVPNKRIPPPPPNPALDSLFQKYQTKAPYKELIKTSELTGLTERQIERWLRRKYKSQRFNQQDMFLDCGTKIVPKVIFGVYGHMIMFSKPWVWNITMCWENYPHHSLHGDIWWYYVAVLGIYWKHCASELLQPGRKQDDRMAMLVHHAVTVLLMTFSWICNFIRIGSLVLMVHEIADIPLLAAKMCRYTGRETPANILFSLFCVIWLLTRCVLYPFWIMRSVFFDATQYMFMPSAYIFMGLLTGLLMLNLMWTWLISGIIVRKMREGKLQDFRSSDSEAESVDLDNTKKGK